MLCHLSHGASPFSLIILAWTMILLFMLPAITGMTGTCHCDQLPPHLPPIEMGYHKLFCADWPGTAIFLITVSCTELFLSNYNWFSLLVGLSWYLPITEKSSNFMSDAVHVYHVPGTTVNDSVYNWLVIPLPIL
jgi:hypothetical protein